jgi:hypothetical protein
MQSQGAVTMRQGKWNRFTYPLHPTVTITPGMLRVTRASLETYADTHRPPTPLSAPVVVRASAAALKSEQSAAAAEGQKAASPKEDSATNRRRRSDNLKRAIFAAWDDGLSVESSASETFEYLVREDQTGFIRGRDGDELMWENTGGVISRTILSSLTNRLTGYRKEYKSNH